ncbi:MAG: hypothetical protein L3J39_17465 [Verrucomicrobiales bacterium]|nr:hypothetical protein [Verrucomicrobiales bacterium]
MYRPNSLTLYLLSLFVWVCPKNTLQAAAPTLDAFYPPGIQVGKTTEVTTVGKTSPWPSQVSCSNPKITFKLNPKKKGIYTVTASKDAQAGPCLVRLHNQDGASKAMIFMLGKLPEILETVDKKGNEDNDSNARAQKITSLPATINGRLIKSGDIDFYRVSLKKGQTLIAHLDSYSMRILMDPYLHLYDSDGSLLVLGNDNGFNLDLVLIIQDAKGKQLKRVDDTAVKTDRDCKLIWSAPADGKYQLLISDLFLKAGHAITFC